MSDEIPNVVKYSSFWPQFILMLSLAFGFGYQVYEVNSQRLAILQQYETLAPGVVPSQNAAIKLRAIMQDLVQAAGNKNTYATQILKESIQAGILQVNNKGSTAAASSASTNAPPAAEPAK